MLFPVSTKASSFGGLSHIGSNTLVLDINVFRDQNPSSIIVLCGDFNNSDTDDLVLDCGLYDVCTEPTRGNNKLDKILCSDEIYFNGIERFTSTLRTDHMCLVAYHGVEQSEKKVVFFS